MGWAPPYATPAELADYMRIGDQNDDPLLALAIQAASRAIDATTRRQFGLAEDPVPRYYTPRLDPVLGRWSVDVDDLMTEDDLTVAADLIGNGTYSEPAMVYALTPRNAAADGTPWTRVVLTGYVPQVPDSVRVTARWGWSTVPDAVHQACLLQASRVASRRDSPYGVAGSPESGAEVRLLAKVDPDVAVALRAYTRRWWAV